MPKKITFTKKKLESLPLPSGESRAEYYDEQVHNLMVRVSSSGGLTFYVRRKVDGISRRILIGRYPDLSIDQARKKAGDILHAIANKTVDFSSGVPEIEARVYTVYELFDLYMESYAKDRCTRYDDMRKDFHRYINDWRNRNHTAISSIDVQNRLNHVRNNNGPSAANHLLILMRAAMNWNLKNGTITSNPWAGIKQYKVQARERFLHPDEMTAFFEALKKQDELIRDYVLISLYTGARRSNVLAMRWDQIDLELAIWRIPLTKNKESQTVPLTSSAVELLKRRYDARKGPWVLPGRGGESHLVEPKRPWYKLLEDAEIEDLRLHDLRRTLASYMAMDNQSLQIIGKALGHKSVASTQIYSRLMNDPVRKAMESAQEQIRILGKFDS